MKLKDRTGIDDNNKRKVKDKVKIRGKKNNLATDGSTRYYLIKSLLRRAPGRSYLKMNTK